MKNALVEIGRLFDEGTVASLSDGQLLERFASRGDGEAFEAIVARHGPVVLAACRSALGRRDQGEAEDAFQATFIILARRAGSFPLHGSLAGWLYRVARRVARQVRLGASRRRAREQVVAGRGRPGTPPDPALEETRDLIRQEVARLPERYRAPILLCEFHGLTRDEAAEAIGCPPGTVAGRLARARELLRERLGRRGLAMPSAVALAAVDQTALFHAAAKAAVASARGETVAVAGARLAARASRGWPGPGVLATLATSAVAAVAIALGAAGKPIDRPRPPSPVAAIAPAAEDDGPVPVDPDDPALADIFAGKVVDVDGKPVAGAKVHLVRVTDERFILPGPGAVRAVTGLDGRFRFSAKDMTFTSFDGLPARRPALLIASADGLGADCVPTWGHLPPVYPPHPADAAVADWTLTLPPDVPIRGRLIDLEGRPLAGAIVRLEGLALPWKEEAVAGLEKLEFPITAFNDTGDLRPRGQAAMILNRGREFVADADGRFRIAGLGRDRLAQLSIRAPGVVSTWASVVTRAMPAIRRTVPRRPDDVTFGADFTLPLAPGRVVSGLVRDGATGRPLPGVRVDLTDPSVPGRPSVASDARGRFSIDWAAPLRPGEMLDVFAAPEPGRPYFMARARVDEAGEAVIDCAAGVPFRLTLRDEAGRPVEAEVSYSPSYPSEAFTRWQGGENLGSFILSRAARQADGSYLGVALPGPGAVTVKLPPGVPYRPAHVDPKAFFAPGRRDWTPQDMISTYGNHDTISVSVAGPFWGDQHDYAAIVLVNPPEGSKPLDLAATVSPPRPRMVTLVDPEGRPVVGAMTRGMTFPVADREPRLRAATFPLMTLHPDRVERITFREESRKLIGFLMARGDGDSPYVVRMQPWATLTGRLVDEQGRPMVIDGPAGGHPGPAGMGSTTASDFVTCEDPKIGVFPSMGTDVDGRFRIEQLVPGQVYDASYYLGMGKPGGKLLEHATFAPGEVRDLGDIRTPFKP